MTYAPDFDLRTLGDPGNRADPYPMLHDLRERSPLLVGDGALVLVGSHRHCDEILRSPHASSVRTDSRMGDPDRTPQTNSFVHLDPPDHTRLRRLVAKAFTPRVVASRAPHIQQITDELLDAAAERGRLDVVADLAYPLPVRIICELLGVPTSDHHLIHDWSEILAHALEPDLVAAGPGSDSTAERARTEMAAYFQELVAERRAEPRDDLLSYLVGVEDEGDRLTEYELLGTCMLLIVAGHETTANLIANAVLALLRHPDQLAALRADPQLADRTVEESLRHDPPIQLTTRIARSPLVIADTPMADGAVLLLLIAAANRDPDMFEDPDRFDIRRPAGRHLAFAAGPHFCLGAGLARIEGEIALRSFAQRVVAPQLDETELRYKPTVTLRGPSQLIVHADHIRAR